jgi:hypothetical protein
MSIFSGISYNFLLLVPDEPDFYSCIFRIIRSPTYTIHRGFFHSAKKTKKIYVVLENFLQSCTYCKRGVV